MPAPLLALLPSLIPVLGGILDKVIPDTAAAEEAKAKVNAEIVKSMTDGALAQIEVNKLEAQHPRVFVAGWRPFIGWVCGAAIAYSFIFAPIASWLLIVLGIRETVPPLQIDYLMELVALILGLSGWRTFEKVRGVASQ